jgi:hypothetical protein
MQVRRLFSHIFEPLQPLGRLSKDLRETLTVFVPFSLYTGRIAELISPMAEQQVLQMNFLFQRTMLNEIAV